MNLRFRHRTVNNQDFLFSLKESQEEYYTVAYELVRKLLTGMAMRSRVFCSPNKYGFVDYPFIYKERQLDSILLPELSNLCEGLVIAEYPITRKIRGHEEKSQGRTDYWCIYKNYSFSIEVKHSYHNLNSNKTTKRTIHCWDVMNKYQQQSSKKDLHLSIELTKGVICLSLHFITVESRQEPDDELLIDFKNKETDILIQLNKDLRKIAEPDFLSCWEIDSDMVKAQESYYNSSYPGLILVSKFYKPISHIGSKKM